MTNKLTATIADYLHRVQQDSGGFISLSSLDPDFSNTVPYLTTFSAATMLNSLNEVTANQVQVIQKRLTSSRTLATIIDRAAQFLLSQKSAQWSFSYWARESPETKTLPYPDDADDTFTALAALTQYNSELLDSAALAKITQLLINIEVEPGGPYRTWFVPPSAPKVWRDVDIAPNAAIAYFLQLRSIRLPKLLAYLDHELVGNNARSRYYPTEYPILYFLSRLDGLEYKHLIVERLKQCLQSQPSGKTQNINMMDVALAASALANCRAPLADLQPAVEIILRQYSPNNWQPFAFCLDPAINGQTYFHGSGALTAAIVLEALNKYQNIFTAQPAPGTAEKHTPGVSTLTNGGTTAGNAANACGSVSSAAVAAANDALSSDATATPKESSTKSITDEPIRQKVAALAKAACNGLDSPLRVQALAVLDKMLKQDRSHSIILLPQLFRQALGRGAASIKDDLIIQLGLAQLYGWCAFSTFDDVIDAQKPPADLPAAMLFLQWFFDSYHSIVEDSIGKAGAAPGTNRAAQALIKRYAQATASAYAREVSAYRLTIRGGGNRGIITIPDQFPNFQDNTHWIDRNMGHALAPLVLLTLLGHSETSPPADFAPETSASMIAAANFFRHYLAARQLHDDAHDWREDLTSGRITPVTALLLDAWRRTSTSKTNVFNFTRDLPKLHELFWNDLINTVSDDIISHAAKARSALDGAALNAVTRKSAALKAPSARAALKTGNYTNAYLKRQESHHPTSDLIYSHQPKFLEHPELLTNLLAPLERGARQAITERDNIKTFMHHFNRINVNT